MYFIALRFNFRTGLIYLSISVQPVGVENRIQDAFCLSDYNRIWAFDNASSIDHLPSDARSPLKWMTDSTINAVIAEMVGNPWKRHGLVKILIILCKLVNILPRQKLQICNRLQESYVVVRAILLNFWIKTANGILSFNDHLKIQRQAFRAWLVTKGRVRLITKSFVYTDCPVFISCATATMKWEFHKVPWVRHVGAVSD